MNAVLQPALGRAFRRAALPLGWYYAITLALPLANGAAQAGAAFARHALIVLIVPPILIAFIDITSTLWMICRQRCLSSSASSNN